MSRKRRSRKTRRNPSESNDYTLPGLVVAASVALSAYHGVKRNNGSVGAGILWGLAGGVFPVLTPAIAWGQGYAQPLTAGQHSGPAPEITPGPTTTPNQTA